MIDTLLERARHVPLVVLSFGNETVSLQELEQKMVRHSRSTRAIEIPYARLAALSKEEKSGRDRELLVLGQDPDAALMRRAVVLGGVERGREPVVPLDADLHLAGTETSAALSLAHDGLEEFTMATTEVAPSGGDGGPEPESSIDGPYPLVVGWGIDRKGEGVVGG